MRVIVQTAPFDLAAETAALHGANPAVGAVVSFLGLVRDLDEGGRVSALAVEHYAGMTEKAVTRIVEEAFSRWDLLDATVIHRVGGLRPAEPIVLVAVASAHRGEAFAACEFIIDYLKTRAPLWKKEVTPEGERWLDARPSDTAAADRWQTRTVENQQSNRRPT
jgi:molybdopterin synthase catalytic subunit